MKKNIAIVMGGYSSEKDISLKSGQVVFENLGPEDKYVPSPHPHSQGKMGLCG